MLRSFPAITDVDNVSILSIMGYLLGNYKHTKLGLKRYTGTPVYPGYGGTDMYSDVQKQITIRYGTFVTYTKVRKEQKIPHQQPVYSDKTSKFSPNTLHLENSEEAAIVVTTAHHYCAASRGHEEWGAPDRRPSSQASASQLRVANHWNVSRNVSYLVPCIVYRIVSWARRIVSALHKTN